MIVIEPDVGPRNQDQEESNIHYVDGIVNTPGGVDERANGEKGRNNKRDILRWLNPLQHQLPDYMKSIQLSKLLALTYCYCSDFEEENDHNLRSKSTDRNR